MIAAFNTWFSTFKTCLFSPTKGIGLSIFRILFGCLMAYDILVVDLLFNIFHNMYVATPFHAPYPGLAWLQLPSSALLAYGLYAGMGISALMMAIGWRYRVFSTLFFILYSYFFFIDFNFYNNHYYLIWLFGGFFLVTNAHAHFSLDAKRTKNKIQQWHVFLFQFQLLAMYGFAGLAKLTSSNWLNAEPLKLWVKNFPKDHLFFWFFANDTAAYIFSYAGLMVDISLPFLFLVKRTRTLAITLMFGFHFINYFILFSPLNNSKIGSFSLLGMATLALFIKDDTLGAWLKQLKSIMVNWASNWRSNRASNWVTLPQLITETISSESDAPSIQSPNRSNSMLTKVKTVSTILCIGLIAALLIITPFRAQIFNMTTDPRWTTIGYKFSWMDFTTHKKSSLDLEIGKLGVPPKKIEIRKDLSPFQHDIGANPEATLQLLKLKTLQAKLNNDIENPLGYAKAYVSLNGRKRRRLLNSFVNLDRQSWPLFQTPIWIETYPDFYPENPGHVR